MAGGCVRVSGRGAWGDFALRRFSSVGDVFVVFMCFDLGPIKIVRMKVINLMPPNPTRCFWTFQFLLI